MEVRQLQIFHTLAEELNFTRTAEKVHTVQSNVTAQIKALEDELGIPLFDRMGRRVTLTDAGRRFQPFAEQALAAMQQGEQAIRTGSVPSGPLRISAPESVLTYRLPQVLRAFRNHFPHVDLIFRPHFSDTMDAELEAGKLDIAIGMCDTFSNPAHKSIRLHTEKILVVGEARHPLAQQKNVKPTDLAGQTLLLTETGCAYRAKLDRVLSLQNVRPRNITEFSSVEAIKECVSMGMGLGVLPAIVVWREMRQNQIVALRWSGPSLDITTHVIWHKDKWISPAMAAFLELIKGGLDDDERAAPDRLSTTSGQSPKHHKK